MSKKKEIKRYRVCATVMGWHWFHVTASSASEARKIAGELADKECVIHVDNPDFNFKRQDSLKDLEEMADPATFDEIEDYLSEKEHAKAQAEG